MHPLLEDCRRAIPGPLFIIRAYRRMVHAVKAYVQCSLQMRCHFRNKVVAPHIRLATNLVVNLMSNGFVSQSIGKLSQLNHKTLPPLRNEVFYSFTCLYPCPTNRALHVTLDGVDLSLLLIITASPPSEGVSTARISSEAAAEFPRRGAP